MRQVRHSSIVRFSDSGQVMVTGTVENLAERFMESKPRLNLETLDGLMFRLMASTDVQELEHLSGKRVSVFGTIDDEEQPPVLTVLGYRTLSAPPPEEGGFQLRKPIKRAAA